jgi:hypothetical protein
MRTLKHHFSSFLRDEDGLILVEGLIMLPLLIWALVAMFIYWDVFRTINVSQKTAYSIADLLSRQRTDISVSFADGLQNVVDFLTPGGHPVTMRITSFECKSSSGTQAEQICNGARGNYRLLFSFSPGNKIGALTESNIQAWKGVKIPTLVHNESVFVVETQVDYKAQLPVALLGLLIGVDDQSFGEFIVTRPRNRRLCLEGTNTCT